MRSAYQGSLTRDDIGQLFSTIGDFKPDFILASNFAGMDVDGMFSRFFEDARIPYVSWFTDTPRMILYGRKMHVSHYMVADVLLRPASFGGALDGFDVALGGICR